MPTATSETESKSRDISICVHHYTLRAPCPKGQENALLVRQSTEYFSVQFRATFVTFSGRGVFLLRPSVHKQGARRYEELEPFFRRAPTNKVLDAMMRGRHLCGMAQQRPPAVISQGGRRGAP